VGTHECSKVHLHDGQVFKRKSGMVPRESFAGTLVIVSSPKNNTCTPLVTSLFKHFV